MLEIRGAFEKNPSRKRSDPAGAPINLKPPTHLPADAVPAWNYLVVRLPLVAFYNCDEVAVEIAATLLAQYWLTPADLKTIKELRYWLGKLGMTPGDRAKLDAKEPEGEKDPTAKYF